jgi:hypothetical protein
MKTERLREEPSTPFSNGTEYENFMYYFCDRCDKGIRRDDLFPEFPENGGCPTWDALENARFDLDLFPSNDVVRLLDKDGNVRCWNICKHFTTNDESVMEAYRKLFEERNT